MTAPAIELDGVDLGYSGDAVVHGLDLRVEAGEVIAVLGANGSGKSTVVRGVFGLAQQLAGTIRIFGTDRQQLRDRGRLGYVPQSHTLGSGVPATVAEVVASGRLARTSGWRRSGAADRAAVTSAIDAVGMGEHARTPVAELSGGQQRRVLIARALASDPELLVLDEPTAGVDAANQEALAVALGELAARGSTIVLIAHELGPVEPLVSRVVVMRAGRKVFDGPRTEAPLDDEGGDWHHDHGEPPTRRPGPGLSG